MLLKMAAACTETPHDNHIPRCISPCDMRLLLKATRSVTSAGLGPFSSSSSGYLTLKTPGSSVLLVLIGTPYRFPPHWSPVHLRLSVVVPEHLENILSCLHAHYHTAHTVSEPRPLLCQRDEWWQRSESRLLFVCAVRGAYCALLCLPEWDGSCLQPRDEVEGSGSTVTCRHMARRITLQPTDDLDIRCPSND